VMPMKLLVPTFEKSAGGTNDLFFDPLCFWFY
jgi:hypothetical protein